MFLNIHFSMFVPSWVFPSYSIFYLMKLRCEIYKPVAGSLTDLTLKLYNKSDDMECVLYQKYRIMSQSSNWYQYRIKMTDKQYF